MVKKASGLTTIEKWTKFPNDAPYHQMAAKVSSPLVYSLLHEYRDVETMK